MKCHHCDNKAVYELDTIEDKTIHVCTICDKMYTACEVCSKQGIWDEYDGNMSKFKETDDWPTCFKCQKKLKMIDNGKGIE